MVELTPTPFEISSYDNPETIRFRKYVTGTHLVLEGAGVETGPTPKDTVWNRNKAKLYRYEPEKPKKYPVPILIVYAHILKPTYWIWCQATAASSTSWSRALTSTSSTGAYRVPRTRACPYGHKKGRVPAKLAPRPSGRDGSPP